MTQTPDGDEKMTIIRVWNEQQGWLWQLQDAKGNTIDPGLRCRATMYERYPHARPSGAVVCGDNIYPEREGE